MAGRRRVVISAVAQQALARRLPAKEGNARPTVAEPVQLNEDTGNVLSELVRASRGTPRAPRTTQRIHVSDLLSKCIRKKVLIELHCLPRAVQRLSLADELTYRQGDAIHDVMKERTAASHPGKVWGGWACKCGSMKMADPCLLSEVDQTVICEHCGVPANLYQEVEFVDDEFNIVGHPDLILYLPQIDAYHVSELKSISPDGFKELVRPVPDHVLQAAFYWYLMHRKGYRMTSRFSILYVTKGYLFKGESFKEFSLDAETAVKRLAPFLEDAKAVLAARNGGPLPARACVALASPEARTCEARNVCFSNTPSTAPQTITFAQAAKR